MAIHIIRWVTWSLLGWWLYRSLTARPERPGDAAAPEDPPRDLGAGPKRGAAQERDDLRRVRGIGPAIESVLNAAGITTWARLAATESSALRQILDQAGPRYRAQDPSAWPAQAAELAAAN